MIGTIASRFHLYWAGSDRDGAVVGFYFAVVETLPVPPVGLPDLPPLPGPRASDYHFTTKTDSVFVFSSSEGIRDRQHAFFIYSVDNQGKVDPTPARVIFNSLDRFPPAPGFDLAEARGAIYSLVNGTVRVDTMVVAITDSGGIGRGIIAQDTVPASSRLRFHWHAEPVIAGSYVKGYRYKLDEPDFTSVGPEVHEVVYPAGTLNAGLKIFTLRAIGETGYRGETNRRFQMNFAPDTWYSGPDPNSASFVDSAGQKFYRVTDWNNLPELVNTLFSCDSLRKLPAEREHHKTFLEIYQNKIYLRNEFDTVNLNSWVILHNGGSDIDSPYSVIVSPNDQSLADTVRCAPAYVLRQTGPNASPIGSHLQLAIEPTFGTYTGRSLSGLTPIFDPGNSLRSPRIAWYLEMTQSGTAYVLLRSEDGDGALDGKILDVFTMKNIVDHVDACNGCGTAEEQELRKLILVINVNTPPYLTPLAAGFVPPIQNPPYAFPTRQLPLNLVARDDDPWDRTVSRGTGGPTAGVVLRYRVQIHGRNAQNQPATWTMRDTVFTPRITIDVPDSIVSPDLDLEVELCDCPQCRLQAGTGTCVTYHIPVTVPPPPGSTTTSSTAAPADIRRSSGPGTPRDISRRSYSP